MSTKSLRINRSFLTVALSLLVLVMAFACNGGTNDTGTGAITGNGDDNNNMGSAVTPPSVQMATLTLGSAAVDCVSNSTGL